MHTEDLGGKTLEHWNPEDVAAAMAQGAITLIDVRTPQEYMFEHIHGALLMPMAGFDPKFLPTAGERPLVLHCGSGVRSRKMAESYLAAGHSKIAHLDGGCVIREQRDTVHHRLCLIRERRDTAPSVCVEV